MHHIGILLACIVKHTQSMRTVDFRFSHYIAVIMILLMWLKMESYVSTFNSARESGKHEWNNLYFNPGIKGRSQKAYKYSSLMSLMLLSSNRRLSIMEFGELKVAFMILRSLYSRESHLRVLYSRC